MSKIGIYSDVHISRTSSILPLFGNEEDVYTYRLKCCSDSIIEAYNYFKNNNVDVVINCGDTFNANSLTSDEQTTYVNTLKNIYNSFDSETLPFLDITLVGNHDKFNNIFNACSLLQLTTSSRLINDYFYFDRDDCDCYCISYFDSDDFINRIESMLQNYPKQHSKSILFMHGDINGSKLTGCKTIENRISRKYLTSNFDIVINGHIHCNDVIYDKDDKKVINIGSLTSHSFADSNDHVPAFYILDTEDLSIVQIKNLNVPVFKSYNIYSHHDLDNMIDELNKCNNKIILKIKCPYDFKDYINDNIKNNKNIIKIKFIITYDNKQKIESVNSNVLIKSNNSIEEQFINFLKNREDLKDNIDTYVSLIK